jgi:hypothetical protein
MRNWAKKFENMMAASTYAEAGEYKTAQDILKEGRRILLALQKGNIDKRTLKYALNACERVIANLDILYISKSDVIDPLLEQFLKELEKEEIQYRLVQRKGKIEHEIKEYTDTHKEIIFVVIDSPEIDEDESNEKTKGPHEWWLNLRCPLVVVMDSTRA